MEYVKLYTDILSDPKLMRAARKGAEQLALIPWLFVFAAKADDDGRLTVGGVPADPEDIADEIPNGDARAIAQCIEECLAIPVRPVLVRDPDGAVRLTAWERRAEIRPSETKEAVAARKRAERERKRAARTDALALAQQQAGDTDRPADAEDTGSSSTPIDAEDTDSSPRPETENESREVTNGHVVTIVTGHEQSRPRCRCTGRCTCTDRSTATTARVVPDTANRVVVVGITGPSLLEQQITLTRSANQGLQERYGGRYNPLIASNGTTHVATEAIVSAGVDLEFAAAVIYAVARDCTLDQPPNSLGYFRQAVLNEWAKERSREDARTNPRSMPALERANALHAMASRHAATGDAAWIAYCREHGIAFAEQPSVQAVA